MVFWQVKGARMIQDRKADVKMVVEVNDYRYCVFPPPKYLPLSKLVLAVLGTLSEKKRDYVGKIPKLGGWV